MHDTHHRCIQKIYMNTNIDTLKDGYTMQMIGSTIYGISAVNISRWTITWWRISASTKQAAPHVNNSTWCRRSPRTDNVVSEDWRTKALSFVAKTQQASSKSRLIWSDTRPLQEKSNLMPHQTYCAPANPELFFRTFHHSSSLIHPGGYRA